MLPSPTLSASQHMSENNKTRQKKKENTVNIVPRCQSQNVDHGQAPEKNSANNIALQITMPPLDVALEIKGKNQGRYNTSRQKICDINFFQPEQQLLMPASTRKYVFWVSFFVILEKNCLCFSQSFFLAPPLSLLSHIHTRIQKFKGNLKQKRKSFYLIMA